jgi:hypothetical protein
MVKNYQRWVRRRGERRGRKLFSYRRATAMRRILSGNDRRDRQEEFEGQAKLESFRFDLKTASESWASFRLRNVASLDTRLPLQFGTEEKTK